MGDPKKQEIYDQILKRSSLEETFQPEIEIKDYDKEYRGVGRRDFMALTFFVEDNYGMRFVAHSGGQNAFVTHFYLNLDSKTAYVIGFNTLASGKEKNTRALDRKIKEYLFKNIFPLFDKKRST